MFICKMNISYVTKKPTYKLYIFKYTLTSPQTLKKVGVISTPKGVILTPLVRK